MIFFPCLTPKGGLPPAYATAPTLLLLSLTLSTLIPNPLAQFNIQYNAYSRKSAIPDPDLKFVAPRPQKF